MDNWATKASSAKIRVQWVSRYSTFPSAPHVFRRDRCSQVPQSVLTDVQWENRLEEQKLDWGKVHPALKGLFWGLYSQCHSCTLLSVGLGSWMSHGFPHHHRLQGRGKLRTRKDTRFAAASVIGDLCFSCEGGPQTDNSLHSLTLSFICSQRTGK